MGLMAKLGFPASVLCCLDLVTPPSPSSLVPSFSKMQGSKVKITAQVTKEEGKKMCLQAHTRIRGSSWKNAPLPPPPPQWPDLLSAEGSHIVIAHTGRGLSLFSPCDNHTREGLMLAPPFLWLSNPGPKRFDSKVRFTQARGSARI